MSVSEIPFLWFIAISWIQVTQNSTLLTPPKGCLFKGILRIGMGKTKHSLAINEFEAGAVKGDDLYAFIFPEQFSELGNIYIHAPGIKVAVVSPDELQGHRPAQRLVEVQAQQAK